MFVCTPIGSSTAKIGEGEINGNGLADGKCPTTSQHLVIPSQCENNDQTYTVVEIQKRAFAGCENFISVFFPRTIKTIGQFSFADLQNLVSMTFENNSELLTIENSAFNNAGFKHNLYNGEKFDLILPDNLAWIGKTTLAMYSVKSIVFCGRAVKYIDSNIFGGVFKGDVYVSNYYKGINFGELEATRNDTYCQPITPRIKASLLHPKLSLTSMIFISVR